MDTKNIKNLKSLALVGLFALTPSMAHAYQGVTINCNPTDGVPISAAVSPGLDCNDVVNKLSISTAINGCTADASAPWDTWDAVNYPAKISAAEAAAINNATVSLKAKTFGSCNFSGTANSVTAAGAGKFKFLNAAQDDVIGGGAFFATVGADLASQSAAAKGLVTKGLLVGAQISIQVGIDLAHPNNANVLACNIGAACPPSIPPSTILGLITTAPSYMKIGFPRNADCVSATNPWACCTGAASGNC